MKKICVMAIVSITIIISILAIINQRDVYAAGEGSFLFSAESNSAWILDKNTRKLIYIQFKKPDKIWKSNTVVVPPEFILDRCIFKAVGGRGTSVFIHDPSTGMTTLYNVKKDHSIESFMVVDVSHDLK